jgi:hypothetical protein
MMALAGVLLLVDLGTSDAVCLPAVLRAGPGLADPFRQPDPKATELNAAGKTLYRLGKWEEARAQYRAAEAADPTFLAPRLNVACSFVRQERFAEATAEVRALLDRAYVPWAREVLEAADLGALKVQPQMVEVRRAMAAAAARWGTGLDESLIFVARQRPPLHIPTAGAGEFILNPHQEVYAFSPSTGRFRQLTAEDGHVLAVTRTPDRRRIVYVTGEKLLRGVNPDGAAPADVALEGVALHELALATMAATPPVPIAGSVRRIEIAGTPQGPAFRIDGDRVSGRFVIGAGNRLLPLARSAAGPGVVVLTANGAMPAPAVIMAGACPVAAHETKPSEGVRAIVVSARGRPARRIGGTLGAGLTGLPLP